MRRKTASIKTVCGQAQPQKMRPQTVVTKIKPKTPMAINKKSKGAS
jgi:hypothetical protein